MRGKNITRYFFLSWVGFAFSVGNGQSALAHLIPACHFPLHYTPEKLIDINTEPNQHIHHHDVACNTKMQKVEVALFTGTSTEEKKKQECFQSDFLETNVTWTLTSVVVQMSHAGPTDKDMDPSMTYLVWHSPSKHILYFDVTMNYAYIYTLCPKLLDLFGEPCVFACKKIRY